MLATSLVLSTCFLGFYTIPKLYYETKKQSFERKFDYNCKLKDINNRYHDLKLLKNKIILINFWDSKCAFCFEKLPYIKELKSKVSKGEVVFLEINPANLDNFEDFRKTVSSNDMLKQFNPLFDEGSILAKKLKVDALPHQFIIDKSGVIKTDYLGFSKGDKQFYLNDNLQYLNDLVNEK